MKVSFYDLKVSEKRIPYLKEIKETKETDEPSYDTPKKAAETMKKILNESFDVSHQAEEYIWLAAFDTRLHLTSIMEVSHGSMDQAIISTSGIMQRALLAGASQIMIVHNHPSGDTSPSDCDIKVTKKLKEACKCCDVTLMDHVILPGAEKPGYYSFLERGKL